MAADAASRDVAAENSMNQLGSRSAPEGRNQVAQEELEALVGDLVGAIDDALSVGGDLELGRPPTGSEGAAHALLHARSVERRREELGSSPLGRVDHESAVRGDADLGHDASAEPDRRLAAVDRGDEQLREVALLL